MKHKSELHDALFIQAYSLSLVVNKIALRDIYIHVKIVLYKYRRITKVEVRISYHRIIQVIILL